MMTTMTHTLIPCRRGVSYVHIGRGLVWERDNASEGIALLKRAVDEFKAYMKVLPNRETLTHIEDAYSALMVQYGFEGMLGEKKGFATPYGFGGDMTPSGNGIGMSDSFRLALERDRFLATYESAEMQAKIDDTESFFGKVGEWYAEAMRLAEGEGGEDEKKAFLRITEEVLDEAFGNDKARYLLEHSRELSPILNAVEAELAGERARREEARRNEEKKAPSQGIIGKIRQQIEVYLDEILPSFDSLESPEQPSDLEYLVRRFAGDMEGRSVSPYASWF